MRFVDWFVGLSPAAQALCREFPPGSKYEYQGVILFTVGYTDTHLIVSSIDPSQRLADSLSLRQQLCPSDVRSGEVKRCED